MKRRIITLIALTLMVSVSSAFAEGKGTSMFSIGLGQNQANTVLINPFGNKFDETNVGAQYQYMFSDDYAFAISGAFGFGSVKAEETGGDEDKITLTSYRFRVGGDRVGKIGDRFMMYMGPGIEFSSAKLKEESTGSPDFESENATSFGISGRVGGVMKVSDAIGILGEINHTFGIASEDGPSGSGLDKVTWMPNTVGAFWALCFSFGGN